MSLAVVNARSGYVPQFGDIYIGRKHSKFPVGHVACTFPPEFKAKWSYPYGNPFAIGTDGDRATVVNKYIDWLVGPTGTATISELIEHINLLLDMGAEEIRLVCWCHPKSCHGHVLADQIVMAD